MPLVLPPPPPFIAGVNLPWVDYGIDFGRNAWRPAGGLAQLPDRLALARSTLADLAVRGLRFVRWFVLCDGRAGIRFDAGGFPLGPDASLLADMAVAVDAARDAGVRLLPVLLDFHWAGPAKVSNGVQGGGRADVLRDASKRQALVELVLAPIFARFGDDPVIHAWDLFNEPEWRTYGYGAAPSSDGIWPGELRVYLAAAAAAARRHARQPITVGSASAGWLGLVGGLGLDFYSPHWYDEHDARAPLDRPVAALGADRPVLLGEFPTRGSHRTAEAVLRAALGSGYCGALLWSVLSRDDKSDFAGAGPIAAAWVAAHRDVTEGAPGGPAHA